MLNAFYLMKTTVWHQEGREIADEQLEAVHMKYAVIKYVPPFTKASINAHKD